MNCPICDYKLLKEVTYRRWSYTSEYEMEEYHLYCDNCDEDYTDWLEDRFIDIAIRDKKESKIEKSNN